LYIAPLDVGPSAGRLSLPPINFLLCPSSAMPAASSSIFDV
jgi:hypothetical protein